MVTGTGESDPERDAAMLGKSGGAQNNARNVYSVTPFTTAELSGSTASGAGSSAVSGWIR